MGVRSAQRESRFGHESTRYVGDRGGMLRSMRLWADDVKATLASCVRGIMTSRNDCCMIESKVELSETRLELSNLFLIRWMD